MWVMQICCETNEQLYTHTHTHARTHTRTCAHARTHTPPGPPGIKLSTLYVHAKHVLFDKTFLGGQTLHTGLLTPDKEPMTDQRIESTKAQLGET